MPNPTSLLFIDGTNLDHRIWAEFGRDDINFNGLFAALSNGTDLDHVHYFSAPYVRTVNEAKYRKQSSDFNFLRTLTNVTLHLGRHQPRPVICRSCSHRYISYAEKGTDIHAAALLVHAACHRRAERLILVTNDNDFAPSVQLCRSEGVEVHVAVIIGPHRPRNRQLNSLGQLRRHAHRIIEVDSTFLARCWRPSRP